MNTFHNFLETMGWDVCHSCNKYCPIGKTYCIHSEEMDGFYWYYETDQFIIDIHDFFIKKEMMADSFPDMSPYMTICSSYIKTANGECFNPYQTLSPNTMFVTKTEKTDFRFLLHANFPYLSVGVNFKESMITDYLTSHLDASQESISNVFFDTQQLVTKPMEKLAHSILNCCMEPPAAGIFLEAKAKEWLSITLDAYLNKNHEKKICETDDKMIENVAIYINDHYALDITQDLLEKIAMMSGTKLKSVFKNKYHMSITEYIQRKRMNMAETLLSTTELEIQDIAKAVGYSSHSRFTTLFMKYKGIYPREVRKRNAKNHNNIFTCPLEKHN